MAGTDNSPMKIIAKNHKKGLFTEMWGELRNLIRVVGHSATRILSLSLRWKREGWSWEMGRRLVIS